MIILYILQWISHLILFDLIMFILSNEVSCDTPKSFNAYTVCSGGSPKKGQLCILIHILKNQNAA